MVKLCKKDGDKEVILLYSTHDTFSINEIIPNLVREIRVSLFIFFSIVKSQTKSLKEKR